MTRFNVVLTW